RAKLGLLASNELELVEHDHRLPGLEHFGEGSKSRSPAAERLLRIDSTAGKARELGAEVLELIPPAPGTGLEIELAAGLPEVAQKLALANSATAVEHEVLPAARLQPL